MEERDVVKLVVLDLENRPFYGWRLRHNPWTVRSTLWVGHLLPSGRVVACDRAAWSQATLTRR
jgi:hypothetical protein